MEMITMLEREVNEFGEEIEAEYLIPLRAIRAYLATNQKETIEDFLEEYNSEDTESVIAICMSMDFDFECVREEFVGME